VWDVGSAKRFPRLHTPCYWRPAKPQAPAVCSPEKSVVGQCGSVANSLRTRENGLTRAEPTMSEFKWRQFEGETILWAVRW